MIIPPTISPSPVQREHNLALISTVISITHDTVPKQILTPLSNLFKIHPTCTSPLNNETSCIFKNYTETSIQPSSCSTNGINPCLQDQAHTRLHHCTYPRDMSNTRRNLKRKLSPPITKIQFVTRTSTSTTSQYSPLSPSSLSSPPTSTPIMSSYRNAVSTLPSLPTHSATTLFLICQFRVQPDASTATAEAIVAIHNNGVAPTFIKSLLTATFQTQPVPPTLQNALDYSEVHFVSLSGDSPNYSIQFRTKISSSTTKAVDFARFGSDRYLTLNSFLYEFVFEKWHTKIDSLRDTLNTTKSILDSIYFLIPPLNSPHFCPLAFISGIPPKCAGRQQLHLDLLTDSFHHSVKHSFDGVSKLHFLGYFRQSFGIQARANYKFTKDHKADVYILFVSNATDMATLSPILFPNSVSPSSPLTILGVPVTMIPIPTRPSASDRSRLTSYYTSVARVVQDILTREGIMSSLPSIVTACIRDPTSASTRDTLLRNKNIVSYTMFYTKHKILCTRLFLKRPCPQSEAEPVIRSWFSSKERSDIFSIITPTTSVANITPDSIILNNVLKNCQSSLSHYATALGVTLPVPSSNSIATTPTFGSIASPAPSPIITTYISSDPPSTPVSPAGAHIDGLTPPDDPSDTTLPTQALPPQIPLATTPSTTATTTSSLSMPPPFKTNVTSLRPKNLLPLTTLEPPTLPMKRPKPPSPPATQPPTVLASLKASFEPNNSNPPTTWEDGYESPHHDDSSTTQNESDDETNFDESIRMHEFETKLTKSVPKNSDATSKRPD